MDENEDMTMGEQIAELLDLLVSVLRKRGLEGTRDALLELEAGEEG